MSQETIVAAFDTAAQATAAASAVEAAGISSTDITQHAGETDTGLTATTTTSGVSPAPKEGFWARLFGSEDAAYAHGSDTTRDHAVYSQTMAGGGTVLSIKVANVEQDADRILDILDAHHPIDIEERANSYSTASAAGYTASSATTAPAATSGLAGAADQTIQLAEEALVVGKRVVNRGTTRIRRYVVETPVSEDVSLHQESVSVERRPVTSGTVNADAFTEKNLEVTEMNEEAVVGKTARVVEEVVVRKDASDRVETVHDTVRREEIEVNKTVDGTTTGTAKPL